MPWAQPLEQSNRRRRATSMPGLSPELLVETDPHHHPLAERESELVDTLPTVQVKSRVVPARCVALQTTEEERPFEKTIVTRDVADARALLEELELELELDVLEL